MAEMEMVERVARALCRADEYGDERQWMLYRAAARAAIDAMHDPEVAALAQSYLDRRDEDWTWVDPEDIKRLARAVLGSDLADAGGKG